MIADAERPVAVAGIMGGEETEVAAETQTVLLEAANFEQLGVLQSGERLHMRSESQTRWEKGVAPELAEPAANHATELIAPARRSPLDRAHRRQSGRPGAPGDPAADLRVRTRSSAFRSRETDQRERLTRLGF